ncbi:MAG: ABC transporter ATP-binding protein [Chloroflexi bacterium]|nr:ABC transporter ATP-binding protein [Chloroflexota bacterium]
METPASPPIEAPHSAAAAGDAPALVLRGVRKRFGDFTAVDGVDLDVRRGEFVTLLGPSGSGKTTTLRMIAGFLMADEGSIEIAGEEMRQVPPYRRDVGMVFQNYALFPHMTAAQNVAFPLQMRNVPRAEQKQRVVEALELVKLASFGDRYPRQLSGGQQQRIALARAIVFRPRLLLMDEPLGALDKKLREALQLEILRISRQLSATVVYVTHAQEEALVMSDRIAIFDKGRIQQLGTGEDLYERPTSVFVADFVGESNMLRGTLARDGDGTWLTRGPWRWRVDPGASGAGNLRHGEPAALVVRPEHLRVVARDSPQDGANGVEAAVTEVLYLGPTRKIELALPDGLAAVVRQPAGTPGDWRPRDEVRLEWSVERAVLVPDPTSDFTAGSPPDADAAVDPLVAVEPPA